MRARRIEVPLVGPPVARRRRRSAAAPWAICRKEGRNRVCGKLGSVRPARRRVLEGFVATVRQRRRLLDSDDSLESTSFPKRRRALLSLPSLHAGALGGEAPPVEITHMT